MRSTYFALLAAVFFFTFASASVTAQTDLARLVDGLQAKYGAMRGLTADFTQYYRDASGRSLQESGRMVIKRPNKMRWEYTTPERKLFVSDGKKLYFYIPDDKQVTISSVKEGTDPRTPFLYLLRRSNWRRDFEKINFANEPPVFAGNRVLLLVPRNAPPEFRRIIVEVDPTNFQIRRVSSVNVVGTMQSFTFNNLRENYIAPETEFKFSVPAGVQVLKGQE